VAFGADGVTTLLVLPAITTAITLVRGPVFQFRPAPEGDVPRSLLLQGNFVYGSGGTTFDGWVQTSLDSGATWTDIAQFHFTTASARFLFNLSSLTPVTTEYPPTDGTLAANTSKDGILGSHLAVKYVSTGTYAGGTSFQLDAVGMRITPQVQ
jgi:hypothetical protein